MQKQEQMTGLYRWFAGVLLFGMVGCASGGVKLERPLPFRVALMPVEVQEADLTIATPASASEEPGLLLSEEDLTAAIQSELNGRGFTDLVVFTPPEVGLTGKENDPESEFEHWRAEAQQRQIDLLLRVTLLYEKEISSETNEKFWLNLPLFLLGGPFCYFIDDRSYTAKARLEAEFYSVSTESKQGGQTNLELVKVLSLPIQVEYNGSQLDFTDRAGKNAGAYALSLIVPAGLLLPNSERVPKEIHDEALAELSSALYEQIASQQKGFVDNDLAGFTLDLQQSSAHRSGNQVLLSAVVHDKSNGLTSFTVRSSAEKTLEKRDLSGLKDKKHRIEGSYDLPPTDSVLHLEIEDGNDRRQSYTFRIEPGR